MDLNMGEVWKQFRSISEKFDKSQKELAKKSVTATAGAGMVTVVVNGQREIISIKIDPEVYDLHDVKMLEDLLRAAVNEALKRIQNLLNEELLKIKGLPFPQFE